MFSQYNRSVITSGFILYCTHMNSLNLVANLGTSIRLAQSAGDLKPGFRVVLVNVGLQSQKKGEVITVAQRR